MCWRAGQFNLVANTPLGLEVGIILSSSSTTTSSTPLLFPRAAPGAISRCLSSDVYFLAAVVHYSSASSQPVMMSFSLMSSGPGRFAATFWRSEMVLSHAANSQITDVRRFREEVAHIRAVHLYTQIYRTVFSDTIRNGFECYFFLYLSIKFFFSLSQMDSNNHFNYGTHSSANSGLKLSSGDSPYTNGSSVSFPQQGKSEYFILFFQTFTCPEGVQFTSPHLWRMEVIP